MDVHVARQPIFDKKRNVFAYELLFRSGAENNFFSGTDGDSATSAVLSNSFHSIGMDILTNGKLGFINFTKNLLLQKVVTVFPSDLVAVEILEDVEPEKEIVEACKNLKDKGYLMVLDDFVLHERFQPFINLADFIKVDFMQTTGEERSTIIDNIGSSSIKYLAEKVETVEEFDEAVERGYSYFQGYFFSKPVIISGKEIPSHKQTHLRLLHEINHPETDFDKLDVIIKPDISLAYKPLSYINSTFYNHPNEIRSIKHALALLGLVEVKKWLSVVVLSSLAADKSEELILAALLRANFCERMAPLVRVKQRSSDLFLMGLFSSIDAILDKPLTEIMTTLPLADEVKDALLEKPSLFRQVLDLALSLERGHWDKHAMLVSVLGLDELEIAKNFYDAMVTTEEVISAT